jgi:threonylcarbamoyladenosine tRNA methylthiotransferase MtaB
MLLHMAGDWAILNNKTVSFLTFGCKMNQYDTDFLKQVFKDQGFTYKEKGPSDLVVVNTCIVTGRSASKCRQAIRRVVRNGSKVVVTGCYPQLAADELIRMPGVIAVTGIRDRAITPSVAEEALKKNKKIIRVTPHGSDREYQDTSVRCPSLTRAFLKIQEGCDDYCTYCIVPYTRGPSCSRPFSSILEEVRELIGKGYKEIVITGTHIGLYGKDLPGKHDLAGIVKDLASIAGDTRLRISSLEPHDVTPDLLDCLKIPQVCHHLHLPVQSGSDRILKKMGRRYTVSEFISIVN